MDIYPTMLILFQVCIFGIIFSWLVRKDLLFGLYFFFLYLYALPAQIGYWFYPELSIAISAYFGPDVWYDYYTFVSLSLISFVLSFRFLQIFFKRLSIGKISSSSSETISWLPVFFISFYLICQIVLFGINYDNLSWHFVAHEDLMADYPLAFIMVFLYKLSVSIILVMYCVVQQECVDKKIHSAIRILLFSSILFFLFVSFRLGNRTDVMALSLGIIIFEFVKKSLSIKRIMAVGIFVAVIVSILISIETMRESGSGQSQDLISWLLLKDYYAPAHLLFTAISYDLVDTWEVIVSNSANAIVMQNHPYLQYNITEMIAPGLTTRSASYAFYIFTEGYLFCGDLGFIYNGVILSALLFLWRSLAQTNDTAFNQFVFAIIATMLVNLVRGQSSYFIKYLYTYVFPASFLYLSLTQKKWRFNISFKENKGR